VKLDIERPTDGRIVNPAVPPKPNGEALGFLDWLVLAYWNLCCAYGLWAFWTGPCAGDWGHCPERELAQAIAAGFWLVVGLIVTRVELRAAVGRRVER
jgi:hypothetical protein